MVVGRISRPQQQQPQPLPLPHEDEEFIDQRMQIDYYTPNGTWELLLINWNTRQHRVIFVDGNRQTSHIEVERNFQITLEEVLEVRGIILHRMEFTYIQGQQDPDIVLNTPVEDMPLCQATIWSHDAPNEQSIQQNVWEAMPEPAG